MITSAITVLRPTAPGVAPGTALPAGPSGSSAFQIAVGEGFTGTVAEWLASLVGATGPVPTRAQIEAAVGVLASSNGAQLGLISGAVIPAHSSLMFAADGTAILGDPTVQAYLWAGLAAAAAPVGTAVQAVRAGVLTDPAWSWTPLAPLYATAGGLLSHTAPTTGAYHKVGAAVTATTILVAPEPPITRA